MKAMFDKLKSPGFMATWAIITAILGIYGTFFYERVPELQLQLIADSNVLDIREQLGKLDISYDGKNLKTTEQTLRAINLRIANTGSAPITKTSYDENEPIGFTIQGGQILETPEISASSYLVNNLKPHLTSETKVTFSPVILESGESFQVKLLVLAPPQQNISITPLGKIAGIRKIVVTEPFKELNKKSIYQLATEGNTEVQIVRSLLYALTFPLWILLVLVPLAWLGSIFSKNARAHAVKKFKERFRDIDDVDQLILDSYLQYDSLWETIKLLALQKEVNPSSFPRYATGFDYGPARGPDDPMDERNLNRSLKRLAEMSLMIQEGEQYRLRDEALSRVDRLISFLT